MSEANLMTYGEKVLVLGLGPIVNLTSDDSIVALCHFAWYVGRGLMDDRRDVYIGPFDDSVQAKQWCEEAKRHLLAVAIITEANFMVGPASRVIYEYPLRQMIFRPNTPMITMGILGILAYRDRRL